MMMLGLYCDVAVDHFISDVFIPVVVTTCWCVWYWQSTEGKV